MIELAPSPLPAPPAPRRYTSAPDAAVATPLLAVRDLSKTYRAGAVEVRVLDGVSAEFEPGCFAAIAGPSGGGKSTLLNILGCLDEPTSGTYHVNGALVDPRDARQRTGLRRERFGFIFQSFNLIPVLSAVENVELALTVLAVPRREARERARAMLARVGLADRAGHRPDQLSGGQQQRVAIARALVKAPQAVFADEPTANLDARNAAGVIDLLAELNADLGVGLVVATHDPVIAERARTVYGLTEGRLQLRENRWPAER